ncbi:MAG: type IV secretion system protein [Deltaproteobacteria bacterium]|nr:type IV secretion system protein [Deltaproteobacteria bacterium]
MSPGEFGVFQQVLVQFQTVTATWLGGLYSIGTNLFYMLATIELILVGITGILRRDFDQLVIDIVRTVAGIMAMFTLFKYGPDFFQNGVILSFTGWASVVGHVPASAMTPGGVMTQGFQLALILLQAIASGWTVFHPSATLNAILLLFSALIILVCFAVIACILLETLVEGYVACVAGTALVATSGTRFTWRFGEGYFGWALGVAVRIFFLYLMVGVGNQLAQGWADANKTHATELMTNWYYGIEAAVEAFLLAVITARIPTKAAQIVDHTVSSTLGDIILGTTLAGAIRDGVKAIPRALEVGGKLGGQAFNGVINLADEGATRAMRLWDKQREEQLKPPAPPTTEDLNKRTAPFGSGSQTQAFNNDWPKTGGLSQPGTSPLVSKAPGTSRLNGNGKGTRKL